VESCQCLTAYHFVFMTGRLLAWWDAYCSEERFCKVYSPFRS
jgi:hypothetical protein